MSRQRTVPFRRPTPTGRASAPDRGKSRALTVSDAVIDYVVDDDATQIRIDALHMSDIAPTRAISTARKTDDRTNRRRDPVDHRREAHVRRTRGAVADRRHRHQRLGGNDGAPFQLKGNARMNTAVGTFAANARSNCEGSRRRDGERPAHLCALQRPHRSAAAVARRVVGCSRHPLRGTGRHQNGVHRDREARRPRRCGTALRTVGRHRQDGHRARRQAERDFDLAIDRLEVPSTQPRSPRWAAARSLHRVRRTADRARSFARRTAACRSI